MGKHTPSTAIALCAAISTFFSEVLIAPQETFLSRPTPPVRIDWVKVHALLRSCSSLQSPVECQRLWKSIGASRFGSVFVRATLSHDMFVRLTAYHKDEGELTSLAPDTDDEHDSDNGGDRDGERL